MKPKANSVFRRDRPDLPGDFEVEAQAETLFEDFELIEIGERKIADLGMPNIKGGAFRVDSSVFERVRLRAAQFGSIAWKDARFTGCDFANARAHRMTLVRVELIDCRFTGFIATGVECQEVLFQNCDLSYGQLSDAKFKNVELDGCKLEDSDLQRADLSGCIVRSCKMARADVRGARLRDTDLRRSDLDGIIGNPDDLRGAVIDASQSIDLARIFGLNVL